MLRTLTSTCGVIALSMITARPGRAQVLPPDWLPDPAFLEPCPVCGGFPGIEGGDPGDCDAEHGQFLSMCWSGNPECLDPIPPDPTCLQALSSSNGHTLNVHLSWGVSAGDYPPRSLDPVSSSSPLLAAGVAHYRGPTAHAERPTIAGTIDAITGAPLLQDVDLVLPFGTAVFRHVRTYSELPGIGKSEFGQCFGAGSTGMLAGETLWDWHGQGWMMGENPLFLIDATWWASVYPTGTPRCYFMPDAHHAIPFVFSPDLGEYTAPPQFDAQLEHNGTWDPIAGSWWEWDGQDWIDHRPTTFSVWLQNRSVRYTIQALYEDAGVWGQDPETGYPISRRKPPAATGPAHTHPDGSRSGIGTPYYGLCTSIDDRYGNRVEIEYCGFRQTGCDHDDPGGCLACCQNCHEKGQIRRVRLLTGVDVETGIGGDVRWTLVYVHREFNKWQDPANSEWHTPQTAVMSILVYENDVELWDPNDPEEVLSCLTYRLGDEPFVRPTPPTSCPEESDRWDELKLIDAADEVAYFGLPDNWRHRVRYLYWEQTCAFDDESSGEHDAYPDWDFDTGRLIKVSRSSRDLTEEPRPPGELIPESTTHTLYRYEPRPFVLDQAGFQPDGLTLTAMWGPSTINAIREALEHPEVDSDKLELLEQWPLRLLRKNPRVYAAPYLAAVTPQASQSETLPAALQGVAYRPLLQLADQRLIRWSSETVFEDYATSAFAEELLTEFLALPNDSSGTRPVALAPGFAEFVDRRSSQLPRRYRVFQFLNTPLRDQPTHGSEVVLYQGMSNTSQHLLAPYRSLLHYPYILLSGRPGDSETPDPGGEYASVIPLDTPMWITVVDEYAGGFHASDSPSTEESQIGQYEFEISGLQYVRPDNLEVPTTRRVIMMNAAGYVLKDRTWNIRSGEITQDSGLMVSYIYESGTLDPNHNGQVDAEETHLPTIRVKEKRSLGWSAARLEDEHESRGLVTVYDYDDDDGWTTEVGAIGVRRGGPDAGDTNPPGPVTWVSQFIRDRDSDRPDLVRYELGFFEPRDTLLPYDTSIDQYSLLDPSIIATGVAVIAHDYVLAEEGPSWVKGKVLSESTVRSGARKSPDSQPYLAIDRTEYSYESSWAHQFRTYGTSAHPEYASGDEAELFVDYVQLDWQGQPRLRVSDVEVDGDGVVIALPGHLSGTDSTIDSPDDLERESLLDPLNHWTYSEFNDRGLKREETHQGLRTEVSWIQFEEEIGSGPEVSLIEEQWIFKDIVIDSQGNPHMGSAMSPGEINRFYAGRLIKSGRYRWPSEGQGVDPYQAGQVELLSELVPLYDSSGRMSGLNAEGTEGEEPVKARIAFDAFGAVNRERHPDGTVSRNVNDPLGRLERVYRGTKDIHEYWGTGTPGQPAQWDDNLVLVEKRYYSDGTPTGGADTIEGGPNDAGQLLGVRRLRGKPDNQYEQYDGNGDLIAPSSEDTDGFLERFGYDWRMRHVWTQRLGEDPDGDDPEEPDVLTHTFTWLDNLDRVRFVATYGADAPNEDPNLDPRLLDESCQTPNEAADIISGHTVGGQGLRRLSETIYNSRGQVEEQREYDVGDASGESYLSTLTFYDHADRPIWTRQPNGLIQRTVYDALGRQVRGVTAVVDEFDVETVLTQTLTGYDEFGHIASIQTRERLHDAAPGDPLDETNSVASYVYQYHDRDGRLLSSVDLGTGSDDDQFVEEPDAPERPPGFTGGEASHPRWVHLGGWERELEQLPEWIKLTSYEYDREGRQVAIMHPDGSRTTNVYDSLGQLVLMAENVTATTSSERRRTAYQYRDGRLIKIAAILEGPSTPTNSQEVGFVFEFDDGSAQITEFRYGAEVVQRDPDTGDLTVISRNGAWIGSVHFPDTATGQPAEDPDLSFQYYSDGLLATRTDARGVTFTHVYDALGNRVQTLADMSAWTGDTAPADRIDRIDFTYDLPTGELLDSLASTDGDPQEIVAHTRYAYDPRGNLLKEIQQHGQAIDEQDPDDSPHILYAWTFAGAIPNQTGGPQNFDRLDSMAYPVRPGGTDRRTVSLQYGAAADIDDLASRVTRISDDELTTAEGYEFLAAYAYAGSMRRVIQTYGYGQNGTPSDETDDTIAGQWLAWDAHDPTGPPPATPPSAPGDGYPALDRFGRTTTLSYRGGAASQREALRWSASYGYDAADSRAWQRISQDDPLNPGTLFDNTRSSLFAYDGLRRLTNSELGELDFTDPEAPEIDSGTTRRTIAWDFDSLGNWAGHTTSTYDPPGTLDETLHADQLTDLRNKLTGIDPGTPSDPQDDEAIISDPLGSIVADDDHFYEYDAWGRLVQVSLRGSLAFDADGAIDSGAPGQWLIHFTYDGLGRLIRTQRPRPGTGGQQPTEIITHQFYYDGVRRVQDIETLPVPGGGPVPIGQQSQWSMQTRLGREYIHGPSYVDEFICSVDRFGAPSFILQDANYNVIALTDAAGAVLTQYTWDPYGQLIDEQRSSAPFADNAIGHQGLFFDRLDGDADDPPLVAGAEGVYYARNRSLSTRFGRWLQRDPNGTALSILGGLPDYQGTPIGPARLSIAWKQHFGDGLNQFGGYRSNPYFARDPMGLFATMVIPGPSDLLQAAFASMVGEYAANMEWDAEWASDWSQADNWHTRGDNSWIEYALARGAYDAFRIEIPFTDIGFNPLDVFAGMDPTTSPGSANVMNKGLQNHHIATTDGSWGKKFEDLFRGVGFGSINDVDENIVRIPHGGRHPREYHEFVFNKLSNAVGKLPQAQAQDALKAELKRLGDFIRSNPHFVYNTAGRQPTGWRGMRDFVQFSRGRYRYRAPR
ncbi:MAG: AHH domain-containing protein [Phycisphaeraceae bacterium]|nr:AHH domain-containing protein [Phycisphaeraceae bacterium]